MRGIHRAAMTSGQARSTFISDLRSVLAEPGFRRLFATRLVSQTGDGIFTAGLGSYVFFSAQSFPNPAAAAAAFTVLYLPYSLIGPFAGVFIDRWSRRQILVWSAVLRSGCVVLAAALVGSGTLGLPLYVGVLAVNGVNRFFLSALSAAVPHVVPQDKLVMANSVAPTSGTIVASLGGIVALGVHVLTGAGKIGSAITLLCGGLCYLAAGLVATQMKRDLLGPNLSPGRSAIRGITADLGMVVVGMVAGARHIARRRRPAAALGATGSFQFLFGILLPMSILLYRNYFYLGSGANNALKHFLVLVIAQGVGRAVAALITPMVTHRISKVAWIAWLLTVGGIVCALLGPEFTQAGFITMSFALGVVAQGVAICTTTIIHQDVDDDFLGRAFSINDMLFNVTFVVGAAISSVFMPISGRSSMLIWLVAAGYLVAAGAYRLLSRQPSGGSSAAPSSPAPSAQRNSS